MFIEKQSEPDFHKIKTDTINRFQKSYEKVVMKEIRIGNEYIISYISSLYETTKISYDYAYKAISMVNIFASDLHEIQLLHNEIRKEDEQNELLHTL